MSKKNKTRTNGANMSATAEVNTQRQTVYLKPADINRGENKGRYKPTPAAGRVENLAKSIRDHGQLSPVGIVERGEIKELVYGFTRVAAIEKLGDRDVWCEVLTETDAVALLDKSVEENRKRNELTLIDLAAIMDRYASAGLKGVEIAKRLDCTGAWVTNCRKLLKLPEVVRDAIADGCLSGKAGIELCKIKDENEIMAIFTDSARSGPSDEDPKVTVEWFDNQKIINYVAKKFTVPETPLTAEQQRILDDDGETATHDANGKPKQTARKLVEEVLDVIRRTLNDAPGISKPDQDLLSAFQTALLGTTSRESLERSIAERFGFETSIYYKDEKTVEETAAA